MAKIGDIANKEAGKETIWIRGCRKQQLLDAGIEKKYIRSEHDWGNWVFLIRLEDLVKLGWTNEEVERIRFNRRH